MGISHIICREIMYQLWGNHIIMKHENKVDGEMRVRFSGKTSIGLFFSVDILSFYFLHFVFFQVQYIRYCWKHYVEISAYFYMEVIN